MATVALSRRVRKVVAYPPLCDMSELQRREFHESLLDAESFEDLPGKWQAAILKAEENRPNLRIVGGRWPEKFLKASTTTPRHSSREGARGHPERAFGLGLGRFSRRLARATLGRLWRIRTRAFSDSPCPN
jgi:hypothetical protein